MAARCARKYPRSDDISSLHYLEQHNILGYFAARQNILASKYPVTPELKDLVNALRELEWGEVKSVCLNVGMKYHLLSEVEENRSKLIERLQDSMHKWLNSDKGEAYVGQARYCTEDLR